MSNAVLGGLQILFSNLWVVPIGVLVGLVVGATPGLTSSNSLAILLPLMLGLPVEMALIIMVSIYVGAECGNSYPAILINIPGTGSAAVATFDGYPMAQKGLAAQALGMSIFSSVIGGIIGGIVCITAAPLIGKFALKFSSVEMTIIILFGVAVLSQLASGGVTKGILAGFLGLLLATTGTDPIWGQFRGTFGIIYLLDGIPTIPALIGLLAFSELLINLEKESIAAPVINNKDNLGLKAIFEGFRQTIERKSNTLRSSLIGVLIGAIPGAGASIASFISYQQAINFAKPEEKKKFGKGNPDGVIAAEAANNGVIGGSLIPLLTLGVPGSASMAVLMVVMAYQGLAVGPRLFMQNGDIAYAVLWTQFAAAIIMLVVGVICAYLFYRVAFIRLEFLVPVVSVLAIIGGFAPRQFLFDMILVVIFGLIGYAMKKYGYPPAAMLLGIILGPLLEANLFRGIKIGLGSPAVFFTRPLAIALWLLFILSFIGPKFYSFIKKNKTNAKEYNDTKQNKMPLGNNNTYKEDQI
ncbi:MAG: tripartite tricarboxylate transporter permease [Peptococcaceae bacterium]